MKVHKFTVTFTAYPTRTAVQNIIRMLRDRLVSYNGITPISEYSLQNNRIYESYTLAGGQEQLAIFYNDTNKAVIGAIEQGHTPFEWPGTNDCFMQFNVDVQSNPSRTTYFIADDNNNIIGIQTDYGGWIFFYRDSDGVRIAFQDTSRTNDSYQNYIGNRIYNGGVYGFIGFGQYYGSVIKAGEYVFSGYAQYLPFAMGRGDYSGLKTGKVLKFTTLQSDERMGYKIEREYPVSIYDGDQAYTPQNMDRMSGAGSLSLTHKKIQIDGQKYIHLGGLAWIPYDTITEINITI